VFVPTELRVMAPGMRGGRGQQGMGDRPTTSTSPAEPPK